MTNTNDLDFHVLRASNKEYSEVINATKGYTVRPDSPDRDYCVGDFIMFRETDNNDEYTGKVSPVYVITYVNHDREEVYPGLVILSLVRHTS